MCRVDNNGKIILDIDSEWISLSKACNKNITVTKNPADNRIVLSEINWRFVNQIDLHILLEDLTCKFSFHSYYMYFY